MMNVFRGGFHHFYSHAHTSVTALYHALTFLTEYKNTAHSKE